MTTVEPRAVGTRVTRLDGPREGHRHRPVRLRVPGRRRRCTLTPVPGHGRPRPDHRDGHDRGARRRPACWPCSPRQRARGWPTPADGRSCGVLQDDRGALPGPVRRRRSSPRARRPPASAAGLVRIEYDAGTPQHRAHAPTTPACTRPTRSTPATRPTPPRATSRPRARRTGHRRRDLHDAARAQQPDGAARHDRAVGRRRAPLLTLLRLHPGRPRRARRPSPKMFGLDAGADPGGRQERRRRLRHARGTPTRTTVLAAMAAQHVRPPGQAGADPPADVRRRRLPHPDHPAGPARRRRRRHGSPPSATTSSSRPDRQGVRRADRRRRRACMYAAAAPPHHAPAGRTRRARRRSGCARPASAPACSPWSRDGRAGRSPAASTRSSCASATTRRSTPRPAARGRQPQPRRVPARPAPSGSAGPAATRRPAPGATASGWSAPASPRRAYPALVRPGDSARHRARRADGRFAVQIGATDIGTGAWTALTQIAADALGVRVGARRDADRRQRPADRRRWRAARSGISSVGAGRRVRARAGVARRATATIPAAGRRGHRRRAGRPPRRRRTAYAHVRVRRPVRRGAGRRRHRRGAAVPRCSACSRSGRVVNPTTARSQLIGGMTMGLSMALHEEGVLDQRFGHCVNHDLASYHISQPRRRRRPSRRIWLDERRRRTLNPMGSKGVGEIGIVGAAAAVANAVTTPPACGCGTCRSRLDKLLRD